MQHKKTASESVAQSEGYPQIYSYPKNYHHKVYLFGGIGDSYSYTEVIELLMNCVEGDSVDIFIDTYGGDLECAIAIIHAILTTNATVNGHAMAEVTSAGTMIFLACHTQTVYPYSNFLFHDGSITNAGSMKFNENIKYAQATSGLYNTLIRDLYSNVFTKEEVDNMIEGKDYYMGSDEMLERLESTNEEENE